MKQLIDFKTDRVLREFDDDQLKDKVKNIVVLLAFYSWQFFGVRVVVTHIYRTEQEQRKFYPNDPGKVSVHQFWRGVDLRSRIYTPEEIEILLKVANSIPYDRSRPDKKTAIYHSVGRGNHLHIQCHEK